MEKHDGGKEAKTEERRNAGPEGGCCSKAQTTNLKNASPDFTAETCLHIKTKLKCARFILTV